jgi:hypothetical protein
MRRCYHKRIQMRVTHKEIGASSIHEHRHLSFLPHTPTFIILHRHFHTPFVVAPSHPGGHTTLLVGPSACIHRQISSIRR